MGYWQDILAKRDEQKTRSAIAWSESRTRKLARQKAARDEKRRKERARLDRAARRNTLRFLPDIDSGRRSEAYRAWRKAVFQRDNYTCQKCRKKKKNLVAHHCMESYANNPRRRLDVNNGVTVCKECHADIHPWLKDQQAVAC